MIDRTWLGVERRRLALVHGLLAVLVFLLWPQGVLAQTARDLSGTWRLDEQTSEIAEGAVYVGLGGNAGIPSTLYITRAANGVVIVGSNMNTSHARTYRPLDQAADSEVEAAFERIGDDEITMIARWNDGVLVAEGSVAGVPLRETLALADAGEELRITIRSGTAGAGSQALESPLSYRRLDAEPPCEEWSTPCRDFSQSEGRVP